MSGKAMHSTPTSMISMLTKFFEQAVSQNPIELVFLYGSHAAEYARPDSDIDLAILFSSEIENCEKVYSLLTEITYRLTKELNKEVNIISIDLTFPHPMLYYNAIVLGIPVFIKDPERFLWLKLEAMYQMEDFQVFGTRWQNEITTRLLEEITLA